MTVTDQTLHEPERNLWSGSPHWYRSLWGSIVTDYRITNERVYARSGLFSMEELSIRLDDIREIHVKQSWVDRGNDMGNVVISTEGNRVILDGIKEPKKVKRIIEDAAP